MAERAHEAEREEGGAGEETGADNSAPLGSERQRGKRTWDSLPLIGPSGAAGPGGLVWARMAFSFS
jgi:hypothetical protein